MIRQAVILSGKIFPDYQIDLLKKNGIDDIIILPVESAENFNFHGNEKKNIKIIDVKNSHWYKELISTPHLQDEFFLINGNTFFDVDLTILMDFAKDKPFVAALRYVNSNTKWRFTQIDDDYKIYNFTKVGKLPDNYIDGYVCGGIYYVKKEVLSCFPVIKQDNISLENDILPQLIKKIPVYGLPMGGIFINIENSDDFKRAQQYLPTLIEIPRVPVLFIDKDGTLIIDTGYPHGKDIQIIKSTIDLVKKYVSKGYKPVMITNQAGPARGKFAFPAMLENINAVIDFYKTIGIEFIDIEYCPYISEAIVSEYKYASVARKPEAGMILRACEKIRIDMKKSIMIGDKIKTDTIKLPYLKSIIIN